MSLFGFLLLGNYPLSNLIRLGFVSLTLSVIIDVDEAHIEEKNMKFCQ